MTAPGLVRRVVVTLAAGAVLAAVASPAAAHPFGPPPTARITANGDTLTVAWSATPDDAVAIGEELGVMPEGSTAAYRQDAAAQVAPSAADEAALSASPALHAYIAERITAAQDGSPCRPEIPPISDFVHEGVRLLLRCPEPVTTVTLSITMLHDIHPAYRTLATGLGASPGQSVFTVEAPTHEWRFLIPAGQRRTSLAAVVGVGAAAGVLAAVAVLIWRRRRA